MSALGRVLERFWPVIAPALLIVACLVAAQFGSIVLQRELTLALIQVVLVVGFYSFAGISGVFSFGHMSFMAIGAYVTALITIPAAVKASLLPDLPSWLAALEIAPVPAALVAGAVAAVVALVAGIPLMRLSGIAAALAMFALLLMVHDVAMNWDAVTRGSQAMIGVPRNVDGTVAAVAAILAVVVVYGFQTSRFGLCLRAARDEDVVARASGVDVVAMRRIAFVLSAFVVGVGGFLYAQFIGSFTPETFFLNITFLTIAMLVVGGQRSLAGAVVGALVIAALSSALLRLEAGTSVGPLHLDVAPGLREVLLAAVMLLILVLRPQGISGGRELRWPFASRAPERARVEPPAR